MSSTLNWTSTSDNITHIIFRSQYCDKAKLGYHFHLSSSEFFFYSTYKNIKDGSQNTHNYRTMMCMQKIIKQTYILSNDTTRAVNQSQFKFQLLINYVY